MTQPPDRDCFGKGASLHVGKCFDVWRGYAFCMCRPVDAASYPNTDKIYCGTTIPRGTVHPNIKTYFDGVLTKTHSPKSGSEYMYIWWTSGGWTGTVRFEFCDGDVLLASRTTQWALPPPDVKITGYTEPPKTAKTGDPVSIPIIVKNNSSRYDVFVALSCKINGVELLNTSNYIGLPERSTKEFNISFNMPVHDVEGAIEVLLHSSITGETGTVSDTRRFTIKSLCKEGSSITETCWDGSIITKICKASVWVPEGAGCPPMPAHGEVRMETCWDQSEIHEATFDAALKTWVPTGEVCPTMPPHGEKRIPHTCWDESEIHSEMFDALDKKAWVPTGETCPVKICEEGEKRSPHTCWDKSTILTEVCRSNAWVPSGESCPTMLPRRVMEMAIPKIVYEGQAIEIVAQVYCGVALSSGEPAILVIDGEEIRTKNTLAGRVSFKWTAAGVGMHSVCVNIPVNPNCPVSGSVCKTITVGARLESLSEQIKAEKATYTTELERLRKLREIEREMLAKVGVPGQVSIPPSLAGSVVEIGGIPTTVPPGGITIPVSPGETIITIIVAGVKETVPVLVGPGAIVGLPALPGGL